MVFTLQGVFSVPLTGLKNKILNGLSVASMQYVDSLLNSVWDTSTSVFSALQ